MMRVALNVGVRELNRIISASSDKYPWINRTGYAIVCSQKSPAQVLA